MKKLMPLVLALTAAAYGCGGGGGSSTETPTQPPRTNTAPSVVRLLETIPMQYQSAGDLSSVVICEDPDGDFVQPYTSIEGKTFGGYGWNDSQGTPRAGFQKVDITCEEPKTAERYSSKDSIDATVLRDPIVIRDSANQTVLETYKFTSFNTDPNKIPGNDAVAINLTKLESMMESPEFPQEYLSDAINAYITNIGRENIGYVIFAPTAGEMIFQEKNVALGNGDNITPRYAGAALGSEVYNGIALPIPTLNKIIELSKVDKPN